MKFIPKIVPPQTILGSGSATESEPPHRTIRFAQLMQAGNISIEVNNDLFFDLCREYQALMGVQIANVNDLDERLSHLLRRAKIATGMLPIDVSKYLDKSDLMGRRDELSDLIKSKVILGNRKPNSKIFFELIKVRNIYAHGRMLFILPTNEMGIEYEEKSKNGSILQLAILNRECIEKFEEAYYSVKNWLENLKVNEKET